MDAQDSSLAKSQQQDNAERRFPLRLFLALFAPVLCLILGGGWYMGQDRIREQLGLVQTSEINHVVRGVRLLDDGLHTPLVQLRALAVNEDVRLGVAGGGAGSHKRMAAVFASLIAFNPAYSQIRWIDAEGRERVRVNNEGGQAVVVRPDMLQQVSGRYFYTEAMRLGPGEVYVSPLDLNVEHGQVETPYKPVLRLATPALDDEGRATGFLMVNVAAQPLLDAFSESLLEARDHGMLLNSDGYWLRAVDSRDEWGFMFGNKNTLADRNPSVWNAMGEMESGQVELEDGLWTWSTVYPLKAGNGQDAASLPHWLVVTHLSAEQLALVRDGAWKPVQTFTLMLLLLFGALSIWLAYAIVGRTRAKVEAVRALAEAAHANQLREAQERFRLVVQGNTNGLLVVDREGRIVLANPALEHMFGYGADEMLGQCMDILLPAEVREAHGKHLAAFIRDPIARPMGAGRELMALRKDGSVFPVEISLSPFVEKGELFVDAFVADISARKRVERLHLLSEARLHALVETHPHGLLIFSDKGAIEMANPALERMFGYAHGELYNLPVERLIPKALNLQNADLLDASTASPEEGREWVKLQGIHKDGHLLPIDVSLARFEEDGRRLAVATVLGDGVGSRPVPRAVPVES